MLVGGVVDHQLDDDPDAAGMRCLDESADILERAIGRVDGCIVRDVVAIIAERRGIEGQQPDGGGAEIGDVIEAGGQAGEVAIAVAVRIKECPNMGLVDDRVAVQSTTFLLGATCAIACSCALSGITSPSFRGRCFGLNASEVAVA
jgi:hypothetical protein